MQSTPESYAQDLREWGRQTIWWTFIMLLTAVLPIAMILKGIPEDMQAWQTGMAAWAAASLTLAIYTAKKARDAFRMAREHEAKSKRL